jgi:hypothetical protein
MSAPGRPKREAPPRGDDAQRPGGFMSAPGRPKRELPLGGATRSVLGAT